jgi:hypothetical protein
MIVELLERFSKEASKRSMNFLLIGGQAIGALGHPRMTMDIDLLVVASGKSKWEELLGIYGYRCFSEGKGFAQFEGAPGWPRVDLMLVDEATFTKLRNEALETNGKFTPSPRHMVALKLHAARSSERDFEKCNQDWLDIKKLIELHNLDPEEANFAALIRRYGGDEALDRIRRMCQR